MDKQYVLCSWDQHHSVDVYVCAPHDKEDLSPPVTASFTRDVGEATKFESMDQALLYREMMQEPAGGRERFRVFELTAYAQLIKA
jgi:hypothetical protein